LNSILFLIIGMMLVTYSPRLLPFILVSGEGLHPYMKRFLSFMPYAMFGALIVPGVFTAISGSMLISVIAFLVACIIAYRFGGVILPVLSAIITAVLLKLI
jgi:branched-subunit amino acid transport protein